MCRLYESRFRLYESISMKEVKNTTVFGRFHTSFSHSEQNIIQILGSFDETNLVSEENSYHATL